MMLIRRRRFLLWTNSPLTSISTAYMTTCHQDRLLDIMMASRAIQDQQLENCLYCNNVLPGTATGNIFQLPTANSAVQEQEQGNFRNMAMCHQDQEQENISNMATCHQDPEPELDNRLELDVL